MARVAIRAGGSNNVPTTSTVFYTVPAASKLEIVDMEFVGPSAVAVNVAMGILITATNLPDIINDAVSRGNRIQWRGFVVVNAGEQLFWSATVPGTSGVVSAILVS